MKPAGPARAVIFDLDGVLVDSEGLHVEAWQRLFGQHGIAVSGEEYAHGIGMADVDWVRYLFARRGKAVTETGARGERISDCRLPISDCQSEIGNRKSKMPPSLLPPALLSHPDPVWWQDAKRLIYRDILARNVRPFPGVIELVRRLHPEFRLAVASNSWREDIETVLHALALRACFDAVTGKEDVDRHKPDPEAYARTAAALGIEPAACTVIEDSPLGIQAAKAAGMRCVGIATTLPADRLAQADLVLASLADPEPVLRFVR